MPTHPPLQPEGKRGPTVPEQVLNRLEGILSVVIDQSSKSERIKSYYLGESPKPEEAVGPDRAIPSGYFEKLFVLLSDIEHYQGITAVNVNCMLDEM